MVLDLMVQWGGVTAMAFAARLGTVALTLSATRPLRYMIMIITTITITKLLSLSYLSHVFILLVSRTHTPKHVYGFVMCIFVIRSSDFLCFKLL